MAAHDPVVRQFALQFVITLINLGLLIALTATFLATHRRSKAPFTRGLVIFAAVLALQALFRVFTLLRFLGVKGLRGPGFAMLDTLTDVAMMISIAVLLYLVNK